MNETVIEAIWYSQIGSPSGVTAVQITVFIWSLMCIIPNALLIHVCRKKTLWGSNFYYTLLNWSVLNVILILSTTYFTFAPLQFINLKLWEASYSFAVFLITLTAILVTMFTIRQFIESQSFCRYFVYRFWCVVVIVAVAVSVCTFVKHVNMDVMIVPVRIVNLTCILVLLMKLFLLCVKSGCVNDETYLLRLAMAIIYVLVAWSEIFNVCRPIIFGDGFLNLVLLMLCDSTTRSAIFESFNPKTFAENIV